MFRWIREHRERALQASRVCCVAYWLVLVVATHWPQPDIVLPTSDKVVHLLAYAVLAFLVGLQFRTGAWKTRRWHYVTAVIVCLWAIIDEVTQIPIPGRNGDVMDCLADWIGCAIGIVGVVIIARVLKTRAELKSQVGTSESFVKSEIG